MKTRTGFVSNSSSSSFIVFGTHYDTSEAMALSISCSRDEFVKNNADSINQYAIDFAKEQEDNGIAIDEPITIDNFYSNADFMDYLRERLSGYEIAEMCIFPDNIEFHAVCSEYGDDKQGGVVGVYLSSVDNYGVSCVTTMKELRDAENTLVSAGVGDAGDFEVYAIATEY